MSTASGAWPVLWCKFLVWVTQLMTMVPLSSIILYFEAQPVDEFLGKRHTIGPIDILLFPCLTKVLDGGLWKRTPRQTPWLTWPLLCSLKCGPCTSLLEMQTLSPVSDLLNPNLHPNTSPNLLSHRIYLRASPRFQTVNKIHILFIFMYFQQLLNA